LVIAAEVAAAINTYLEAHDKAQMSGVEQKPTANAPLPHEVDGKDDGSNKRAARSFPLDESAPDPTHPSSGYS
jgi:hypothetical protein